MNATDLLRLHRLAFPSPVLAENAERKAAWVRHFLPQARAEIEALVEAGGNHPDVGHEAKILAGYMAIGPTCRGDWPPQPRAHQSEYRGDGTDRCPGCARSQFYVGRIMAECAFCGAAVPLARQEIAPFRGRRAA